MQSIDLMETYAYVRRKDLVSEKEDIKCNNIIKRYKNDYDDVTNVTKYVVTKYAVTKNIYKRLYATNFRSSIHIINN